MRLLLASQSATRRRMLEAAGIRFEIVAPALDEEQAKAGLIAAGFEPRDLAEMLAEMKAKSVAGDDALVIGADQILELDDGAMLSKPATRDDYTYERHVRWMRDWLIALDLTKITLFCQDWGGLIGLRLVAAFPDRFARLVIANTGLPIGTGFSEGFNAWLAFSQNVPHFPAGAIVNGGVIRDLTPAEIAAYDAPFPDESYKEGARQFPTLVPVTPDHPVWDSFFRIDEEKLQIPGIYGPPIQYLGIFEDNDPTKRLMVIANWNNDIGDAWQWSDEGFLPIDLTNEAYQLGVNYVMYALTH